MIKKPASEKNVKPKYAKAIFICFIFGALTVRFYTSKSVLYPTSLDPTTTLLSSLCI